ncbi:MAG: hypothetical protein GY926_16930 [bacterium]|nr:hypothetical protein [bacterium]
MRFIVDDCKDFARQLQSYAVVVRPVMEFVSKADAADGKVARQESKTSDDRQELVRWEIHVPWIDPDSEWSEQEPFKARVWAPTGQDLKAEIVPGTPISFGGLAMNVQARKSGDGRGYSASFSAESFTTSTRPSVARAAKAEPAPPPPATAKK